LIQNPHNSRLKDLMIHARIFCIYLICILSINISVFGQQTLSTENQNELYDEAMMAFDQGSYELAYNMFDKVLSQKKDFQTESASYFKAISALYAGKEDGFESVEAFVLDNPVSPHFTPAHYVLGNYWFDKGDFTKTISYFGQCDVNTLERSESETLNFKLGFAQFKLNNFEEAKTRFTKIIEFKANHFLEASYYLANIHYSEKKFNSALEVLQPIADVEGPYNDKIVLLTANILFKTKQFKELYKLSAAKLTNAVTDLNKELNKLCAEAYFEEKKYTLASKHFQRYLDLTGDRADADTFYKTGLSYFNQRDDDSAIKNFKKSGLAKGAIGEISSFYLGKLYLKQRNLNYAYAAFRTVADNKEPSDKAVYEEATFIAAKLSFERGLYDNAIIELKAFNKAFPQSRWLAESNELMAQAFLKTSNYQQAIDHIETIANKTTTLKKAYQRISLQQGQLYFNDSKFELAIGFFDKSLIYQIDKTLAAQAFYLNGESYALLQKNQDAERSYTKATALQAHPWSNDAYYGLGYIHYNAKSFSNAASMFETFIAGAKNENPFYNDAILRLADCQYVAKEYTKALTTYGGLLDYKSSYVTYQKGLIYRLMGDVSNARIAFNVLIANQDKEYMGKAIFQKGDLEFEASNFPVALKDFDKLLKEAPESELVPFAKSRQGLSYFNINDFESAKRIYVDILQNHLNSPVASSALLGLQEVQKRGVVVDNFEALLSAYQIAHPDDSSLEVVAFESAKTIYYGEKYNEAVTKFTDFINKYPQSGFLMDAEYFRADSYFRNKDWVNATKGFEVLLGYSNSSYQSRAFDKRGKALLAMEDYKGSLVNYNRMLATMGSPKDSYLAHEGRMLAYLELDQFDSAMVAIESILSGSWKPANAESKIWLTKAKILMAKGSFNQALDELIKVMNDAKNENAAEANYLMGEIYFKQGAFKNSLEVLFDLNKSYGAYRYWIGKSFLLIADNYLSLNELLQARATLESVVQNTELQEIRSIAKQKLKEIEEKEKKIMSVDSISNDTLR
jgi:tetratricopeptide (TPR) repeat protein